MTVRDAKLATVHDMFRLAVARSGDLPFLAYPAVTDRAYLPDGASFSYGEAAERVDAVAAAYRAAGYGPGHRVALVLGNRPDYF